MNCCLTPTYSILILVTFLKKRVGVQNKLNLLLKEGERERKRERRRERESKRERERFRGREREKEKERY
jgi:hypothetical protein